MRGLRATAEIRIIQWNPVNDLVYSTVMWMVTTERAVCTPLARLISITIMVMLFSGKLSRAEEWSNYTNANTAHDLYARSDTLWAATTGGLLLMMDESNHVFTNADGLGENDLRFVTADSTGRIWCGGVEGTLTSFELGTETWSVFEFVDRDGRPLTLLTAFASDPVLWVGSSVGIHKFDMERFGGEITETYRRFGNLPADEAVTGVAIHDDKIWVSTMAGCAFADIDDINLQDYSHWRSFSRGDFGLTDDDISALAVYESTILAGTGDGIFTFVAVDGDTVWEPLNGSRIEISDLWTADDALLAATPDGVLRCSLEGCQFVDPEGMSNDRQSSVVQTSDGTIWAAGQVKGGYLLYQNAQWSTTVIPGIRSNVVDDVLAVPSGEVWAVHPGDSTSYWNGEHWDIFPTYRGGVAANSIALDHEGYLWFGGHGTAATRVNPRDPVNDQQHFDEQNSPLRGSEPPPNDWYVVVLDIVVDDSGRVWFANAFDYADRVLVFYDHGCWGYFGTNDGFFPYEPISLFPLTNEILVGFESDGIADFELDTTVAICINGEQNPQTPIIGFLDETNGLPARQVREVTVDLARTVWVGTTAGLVYWDPVWRRFRPQNLGGIAAPRINALAVDSGNVLWVGADEGLFRIDAAREVRHFTPENSGLVDQHVTALSMDKESETLWIGTEGGISALRGMIKGATPVEEILAYPNPFVISRGDEEVRFDAAFGTELRIFNAAGELIIDLGNAATWDGRNAAGELVASGIYLFVALGPDGQYGQGKLAVLRK